MKRLIAPSILSADFAMLGRDTAKAVAAGADWVHVDVMDGHFVPNLTLGPCVVAKLKPHVRAFMDVHLMISAPTKYVDAFAKAGADLISFHVECADAPAAALKAIRKAGVKAGVCIKPDTSVRRIERLLPQCDLVTVMSVEPGFGGQKFMPAMMAKVAELKALRGRRGAKLRYLIEVDGGITTQTAAAAWAAGADVLVAGTAVFGPKDYKKAIRDLRQA